MTILKPVTLTLLLASGMVSQAQAARIIDEANHKAVNQVHWHKVDNIAAKDRLNQAIPDNTASVVFLRKLDKDGLQTSANVAINDRFQVSWQPNNYSQIYTCVGSNQISAEITGHKNNDLLKNANLYQLSANTTYFFEVDVDTHGNATVSPISQNTAMAALENMAYQTHQITRVVPNCPVIQPPAPKPVAVAPAPIQYESIELKVLFDNDKSLVKPDYYPEVKRVADFMARHPEVSATIEGHTDSNASDSYNLKLSQRRVDAVKQILIGKFGIESSRLNAIGYGESRPIATNATAEGRQQNRRVVAVFQAN